MCERGEHLLQFVAREPPSARHYADRSPEASHILEGVFVDEEKISPFSCRNRAELLVLAQEAGRYDRGRAHRLVRCETALR